MTTTPTPTLPARLRQMAATTGLDAVVELLNEAAEHIEKVEDIAGNAINTLSAERFVAAHQNEDTPAWPRNAADIRLFLKHHFIACSHPWPGGEPCDDDLYEFTAHDLLSAFEDWVAFFPPDTQAPIENATTAAREALEMARDWISRPHGDRPCSAGAMVAKLTLALEAPQPPQQATVKESLTAQTERQNLQAEIEKWRQCAIATEQWWRIVTATNDKTRPENALHLMQQLVAAETDKLHTPLLTAIQQWHQRARPQPDNAALSTQIGCHLEEVCEMIEALDIAYDSVPLPGNLTSAVYRLGTLATKLKDGSATATIIDREAFTDSLADQIVTAVGVGHCAGIDVPLACERVNASNWTKFVNGQPVFLPGGKIGKGPDYTPPDLTGCY